MLPMTALMLRPTFQTAHIAPDGGVLVVDEDGGLSRVSAQGTP
jgi:hypothetical protein